MTNFAKRAIEALVSGIVISVFLVVLSQINIWGFLISVIISVSMTLAGVGSIFEKIDKLENSFFKGFFFCLLGILGIVFDLIVTFGDTTLIAQSVPYFLLADIAFWMLASFELF